jgi:hypothetical protein
MQNLLSGGELRAIRELRDRLEREDERRGYLAMLEEYPSRQALVKALNDGDSVEYDCCEGSVGAEFSYVSVVRSPQGIMPQYQWLMVRVVNSYPCESRSWEGFQEKEDAIAAALAWCDRVPITGEKK